MLSKIIDIAKNRLDGPTMLLIIGVNIFTILVDGRKYKRKKQDREANICNIISYSYISIGIIFFIILKFI